MNWGAGFLAFSAILVGVPTVAAAQSTIINIGHENGFTYVVGGGSDPAPVPGQFINFIGGPPSLNLAAGDYRITNGTGMAGANPDYAAWSYNLGNSSWAWGFVAAKDTGEVLAYGEAGYGNSKAQVAALSAVQNFSMILSLPAPTTVVFTLRDYYVPDNGGGISLAIAPLSRDPGPGGVPEPAAWALMLAGFGLTGSVIRRRRVSLA